MALSPIKIDVLPFRVSLADNRPHRRREILCKRPFRKNGIRLEAEEIDSKKVIHCYGHGGSGWTFGPGCGNRILEILLERLQNDWRSLADRDITIIGGGVIGLFAAYYLSRHKLRHPDAFGELCIVAESFDDLTSNNAGGLFGPFSIGGEPDIELLVTSYDFYHNIALGDAQEPEFENFDIELLTMFSREQDELSSLVELGYTPHGIPAQMCVDGHVHDQFVHQVFYMDVALLMKHLFNIVTRQGVRAIRGLSIQNFSEVSDPIVINCAGLRARELTGDTTLRPILGHLIRLQNQPRALLDIGHNLHVLGQQLNELKDALAVFWTTVSPDTILATFTRYAESPGNILDIRFPGGWNSSVTRLLDNFFAVLHELRSSLETSTATQDPDTDGVKRARVFTNQRQRNRFVDSLALIIRVAELCGDKGLYSDSMRLFCAYIPRYSKRYIFLIEQEFPVSEHTDDTYSGIAYFMPMLHETIVREANGQFRYASEDSTDSDIYAGVAGGTIIEQEHLDLQRNREEFDRIAQRLHYLGFR